MWILRLFCGTAGRGREQTQLPGIGGQISFFFFFYFRCCCRRFIFFVLFCFVLLGFFFRIMFDQWSSVANKDTFVLERPKSF